MNPEGTLTDFGLTQTLWTLCKTRKLAANGLTVDDTVLVAKRQTNDDYLVSESAIALYGKSLDCQGFPKRIARN